MIQLHLDLLVDPAKEAQMLDYFNTAFRPAASKFRGYVDLKMLKFRTAAVGTAPQGMNYRFSLTYESEELRQLWVTSDVHTKVWTELEKMFLANKYDVLIFDINN
jgi:hypothetical protein